MLESYRFFINVAVARFKSFFLKEIHLFKVASQVSVELHGHLSTVLSGVRVDPRVEIETDTEAGALTLSASTTDTGRPGAEGRGGLNGNAIAIAITLTRSTRILGQVDTANTD